jgi:Chitobiase/beta-hexosaminidase C-terminal domain
MKRDWSARRFTFRTFAPGTTKGARRHRRAGAFAALVVVALGGAWLSRAVIHARSRAKGDGALGQLSWWQPQIVHAQAAGSPLYTSFDAPDAGTGMLQGTAGLSINPTGDIAGIYLNSPNSNVTNLAHGFLRIASSGATTEFDAPDAGTGQNQGTFAISIDAADDVAGQYSDSNTALHGFVRNGTSGVVTEFDVPGAPTNIKHRGTIPMSIAAGNVTGFYSDAGAVRHGFVCTDVLSGTQNCTTFDPQGAGTSATQGTIALSINSEGDVAGFYIDANKTDHGFIRTAATGAITAPIDAPGAGTGSGGNISFQGTVVTSIDAAGDVAGVYADSSGVYHGFLRAAGTGNFTSPIDAPLAGAGGLFPGTSPASLNNAGVMAGIYQGSSGLTHGFVRAANGTITAPLDEPNATTGGVGELPGGTANVSINDSGTVTGGYFDKNGVIHGFVLGPGAAVAPTFNPPAGTYSSTQSVAISDSDASAAIYYTTNGQTPTTASTLYSGPISVSSTETIEAIAADPAAWSGSSAVASAAYTISTAAPDFEVTVNPTSLTIVAGQSGQATFTVTPENGFNSAVSFSCSGLPAEASCSFNPASVTPNGAAVTSTLTVTTTAAGSALRWPGGSPNFPAYAALTMIGFASIFVARKRRRHVLATIQFAALCVFLAIASGLASCGGNGTGGGNQGTPPGTTAISVSAGAGGAGGTNHAVTLTITVTQ